MKVHIVVTDDLGATYEGVASMTSVQRARKPPKKEGTRSQPQRKPSVETLSYSSNPRAFMNTHGRGMSGTQKFALLLGFLAKGKPGHAVPSEEISKSWNRMKSIMGGAFNGAYVTRAKDKGWINSPKNGQYVLTDSWKDAFNVD